FSLYTLLGFFFQAEDGIRYFHVTEFRRVLFRSPAGPRRVRRRRVDGYSSERSERCTMRFRSKVAMGCVLAGAVSHAWSAGEELPFTLERCDVRLRVEPETRRVAGRAELVVEARDA